MNMIKHRRWRIVLRFGIALLFAQAAFGEKIGKDDLRLYKCEVRRVSISNVDLITVPPLFDGDGNSVNQVGCGIAVLVVASEKMILDDENAGKFAGIIEKMGDWKKSEDRKAVPGDIVGLVEEAVDALVFLKDRCWLVRMTSERIFSIEVEVIVEKDNVKIATAKNGEKQRFSDDPEIVGVISKFIYKGLADLWERKQDAKD